MELFVTRAVRPVNGRVHLSREVLRLDDHAPIYRRRREWRAVLFDLAFRYVVPFLALVFAALALIGFIWVLLAIGRAIHASGGIS